MVSRARWQSVLAALGLVACSAGVFAQASAAAPPAAPSSGVQAAFRQCDARAFLAMNLARIYLDEGRNRPQVIEKVKRSDWGLQMAEALFKRVDEGRLQHPAEFAADVLGQCAAGAQLNVGASKTQTQLCLARADMVVHLHGYRTQGLSRADAVARTAERLQPREVYPVALIDAVAGPVFTPPSPPDLNAQWSQMLWGCIRARPARAASAAASS
jgi:hypothetical protein